MDPLMHKIPCQNRYLDTLRVSVNLGLRSVGHGSKVKIDSVSAHTLGELPPGLTPASSAATTTRWLPVWARGRQLRW